jgi:hypothetical protein
MKICNSLMSKIKKFCPKVLSPTINAKNKMIVPDYSPFNSSPNDLNRMNLNIQIER